MNRICLVLLTGLAALTSCAAPTAEGDPCQALAAHLEACGLSIDAIACAASPDQAHTLLTLTCDALAPTGSSADSGSHVPTPTDAEDLRREVFRTTASTRLWMDSRPAALTVRYDTPEENQRHRVEVVGADERAHAQQAFADAYALFLERDGNTRELIGLFDSFSMAESDDAATHTVGVSNAELVVTPDDAYDGASYLLRFDVTLRSIGSGPEHYVEHYEGTGRCEGEIARCITGEVHGDLRRAFRALYHTLFERAFVAPYYREAVVSNRRLPAPSVAPDGDGGYGILTDGSEDESIVFTAPVTSEHHTFTTAPVYDHDPMWLWFDLTRPETISEVLIRWDAMQTTRLTFRSDTGFTMKVLASDLDRPGRPDPASRRWRVIADEASHGASGWPIEVPATRARHVALWWQPVSGDEVQRFAFAEVSVFVPPLRTWRVVTARETMYPLFDE